MRFLFSRAESFSRFTEGFTLPLERRGLVLVQGDNRDHGGAFDSNGAGKSLLFEAALAWPLFGKMSRYGNERLGAEEVCFDGHDANVAVGFQTSRGQFFVRRHRRARGSPTLRVYAGLDESGDPLRGTSLHADDTTDDLTSILGFDYQTLCSALFLQGTGLTVARSTFGQQMKILESILRFDRYTTAAKIAADKFRVFDQTVQEQLRELEHASHDLEDARRMIAHLEELDESERENELRQIIMECEGLAAEHESVAASAGRLDNECVKLHDQYVEASTELKAIRSRYEGVQKLRFGDSCPTCEQPIKKKELLKLLQDLDDAVYRATSKAEGLRLKEGRQTETLRETYQRLKEITDAITELRNAKRELQDLESRQAKRLTMINTHRARLMEAEQKVAQYTDVVADVRRLLFAARACTRDKLFEEMKARTMNGASPVLNNAAQRYSDLFTDGAIRVEFNMFRESRSDSLIRLSGGSAPTYEGLSNGEKRRVDIVLALSLRELARWRLGEPINIALWDEVFDPLDESGIERAMEVLQQDMDELETVFVITHNIALRSLFPSARRLTVVREGGMSRVEPF